MKKILKIILIGFVVLIGLSILGALLGGSKSNSPKDAFNEGQQSARNLLNQETFTKESALKKVQDYRLTVDLQSPSIPKGTTILEAYNIRGQVPAIKNLGWNVEETGEAGKYTVSFKETVGELTSEPRWEVTKDAIKALNGIALTYTPEFRPQQNEVQGTDNEKQVYATLSELMDKYDKEYPNHASEQIDPAEKRAVKETAERYNITEEKVRQIFATLESTRYNQ